MKFISVTILQKELSAWNEQVEYWNLAINKSLWIDNGKGGCVNKNEKLIEAKAKVNLLAALIKIAP